jgi:AbiV family abortive infection protein
MPSDRRLIELAVAAVRHAREQLQDAEALLARGRWASALVDAALGLEEMGKSYLCTSALTLPVELHESEAAAFWKMFDSHTVKAVFAQVPLATYIAAAPPNLTTLLADITASGAKVNDAKFRGLYVDVDDEGEMAEPDDVTENDARAVVDQLARALDDSRARGLSFEDADPAEVAEFIAWWRETGDPGALIDPAKTEDDVARMLVEMRALVRDEGPTPAWLRQALPGLFAEDDADAA